MSDDIIKRLREALAAGPTVGPWTMLPACAGEQCVARINSWEAVPPNGVELAHDSIDANYIAAASPDNIRALLDRLDAAEAENERMRAVVSALAFQASRDPFVSVGHWCEHGPCAAIIRDISNPNADHHGPDWTERDSEYLK